ncbi:MAG: hypothetical protein LH614_20200 [Pyrinomonadaceae bacterium]|nr:hypothetical protein [Pyrinomonadaceae bacterium]
MNIKQIVTVLLAALTIALSGVFVEAQIVSDVTLGLKRPAKVILTEQGNLIVAEEGTGIHDGRISIIDPQTGLRRRLLDGLPSVVGRYGIPQGPSGLVMRGRTLYFTIGEGNPTVACPLPCTEIPNPTGASSPIFSSVLAVLFSASTEMTTGGFTITPADDLTLKNGEELEFNNGKGDKAKLRLVADFPDVSPDPIPGAPENVAASNPFGIELIDNHVYVVDGGNNKVWKADINKGEIESLVTFPTIILPTSRIEAVPTSIRVYGEQLLVTLLRGGTDNPLGVGLGEVRLVNPLTGSDAPFITGLTSTIDVLPVQTDEETEYF